MAGAKRSSKKVASRQGKLKSTGLIQKLYVSPFFEKAIIYLLFMYFFVNLFRALRLRYPSQTGDAAGFVDVLSNPGKMSGLHFSYGDGLVQLRNLISTGDQFVCPASFSLGGNEVNFFYYHAYAIGFITRHFNLGFISPASLALALLALSVTFGLLTIYNYLRENETRIIFIIPFLFLILVNPILFMGISWNPYVNRLFFGPAIFAILGTLKKRSLKKTEYYKIIIAVLICILISERSSFFIGIAMLGVILFRRIFLSKLGACDYFLMAISILGILWYAFWTSKITVNSDYPKPSKSSIFANFTDTMNGSRTEALSTLLLVLLPFLFLICISRPLVLLTFVLLIPVIVVSSEKGFLNSYYAHYQSDFFPIILAISTFCLVQILELRDRLIILFCLFFVVVFSFIAYNLNAYSKFQVPTMSLSASTARYFQEVSNSLGLYFIPNTSVEVNEYVMGKKNSNEFFQKIALSIPVKDRFVSTPEEFMPSLIEAGVVRMNYFPVGVGTDKYVIAPYASRVSNYPDVTIYGAVPVELRQKWSTCIQRVLEENYNVRVSQEFGDRKAVVYERK